MVRTYIQILAALASTIFVSTIALAAPTFAQTPSQAITISPASTRITLNPGESVTNKFEIINSGSDGYQVELSVAPYRVIGEQYDPSFTQIPGTVDASKWVVLQNTAEPLDGLKVLSTSYTVTVPANTPPGGYYAVVFAQTSQEKNMETSGVVPHNRVGNILYITVKGDIKESGDAQGTPLPFASFNASIPLGVKVTNTGGVHFESKVTLRVTDLAGKEVFKTEQERFVLPSTIREITSPWDVAAPFGIYTVERSATVAGQTVTLENHRIVVASPWFVICVAIFIGSATSLLIVRIRHRKKAQ